MPHCFTAFHWSPAVLTLVAQRGIAGRAGEGAAGCGPGSVLAGGAWEGGPPGGIPALHGQALPGSVSMGSQRDLTHITPVLCASMISDHLSNGGCHGLRAACLATPPGRHDGRVRIPHPLPPAGQPLQPWRSWRTPAAGKPWRSWRLRLGGFVVLPAGAVCGNGAFRGGHPEAPPGAPSKGRGTVSVAGRGSVQARRLPRRRARGALRGVGNWSGARWVEACARGAGSAGRERHGTLDAGTGRGRSGAPSELRGGATGASPRDRSRARRRGAHRP